MTTEELIEQYRTAAMSYGDAIDKGDSKTANRSFEEGVRLSHYFRRGGPDMQQEFMVLLDDIEPWVRSRAATHALEFAPEQAVDVLEKIAAGKPGMVQFSAEMVLRRWHEGTLQIP